MRLAHDAQVMPPMASSTLGRSAVPVLMAPTTGKAAVRTTPACWKSRNSR